MKTIYLNHRELKQLTEIVDKFPDTAGSIKLSQTDSNGIGSILTVSLGTYVNDIYGEFTITLTDEGNW
jgi:hypothetical protein